MSNHVEGPVQVQPEPSPSPPPDQLAWVREAIDGLRHSQNIAVAVLGGGIGLLAAVFGGFMIWQASEIAGLSENIDAVGDKVVASERRVAARIDAVGRDVVDVRDRVSRIEAQIQGVSEQLARFQKGALDPEFNLLPPIHEDAVTSPLSEHAPGGGVGQQPSDEETQARPARPDEETQARPDDRSNGGIK
jgi:hypothetical protein